MGNSVHPLDFPSPALVPLPGQGSKDPSHARDINEAAASREATEHLFDRLHATRNKADRRHHQHRLRLLAVKLAKSASSEDDLGNKLRLHLSRKRHPQVSNETDAKLLIDTAFETFKKMHTLSDPDLPSLWATALLMEYSNGVVTSRRERIGEIVKHIDKDALDRDRIIWNKRVMRLANQAHVSFAFAQELLSEYERLQGLPLPKVEPRLYPGIQGAVSGQRMLFATTTSLTVGIPLAGVTLAMLIENPWLAVKALIAMLGAENLTSSVIGKSVITGRRLETWERVVNLALTLIPLCKYASAFKYARNLKYADAIIRASARLSGKAIESAQFIARLAARSGRSLVATVRFAQRIGGMSQRTLARLSRRVALTLRSKGKSLTLTKLEETLAKELDDAVREFERNGFPMLQQGRRLPKRLIVGGGRNTRSAHAIRPSDLTLNINPDAGADLTADIANLEDVLNATNRQRILVDEVFFERVPMGKKSPTLVDQNDLKAAFRNTFSFLRPGGKLRIETGKNADVDRIMRALREVGFSNVRLDYQLNRPAPIFTAVRKK